MNKKTFSVVVCAFYLLLALQTEAQQARKIPRIGFVSGRGDPNTPEPQFEACRQGLRDFGYVEGENILVEYRYAEGKLDRVELLDATPKGIFENEALATVSKLYFYPATRYGRPVKSQKTIEVVFDPNPALDRYQATPGTPTPAP